MGALRFLIFLKFISDIEAIKSKSVNLALETVLEFNQKNNAADLTFIDNVQQFLDKVKTVIGTNNTARRFDSEAKHIKFTDFIKTAIEILKSYEDGDLEDAFAVFDDEVRKYHYRGCKFYELVEDRNVRRFVANKLDEIKGKPAENLRKNLDNAIQVIDGSRFSTIQTEFVDYVNSLYRQDSSDKFKTFLNNLQTYSSKSKRANLDLINLVREGIRSVIFDHYSALNINARKDLKIKLETSWRSVKYPNRVEYNVWTVRYTSKDMKTIKYNKINDYTENIEPKRTTRTVKRDDSELADGSNGLSSNKKLRYLKEVYFNTDKYNKMDSDGYFKRESTLPDKVSLNIESDSSDDDLKQKQTRPDKIRSRYTVDSDSDIEEEMPTTRYKITSKKHAKYKVTKPKLRDTHKRLVTLYPEEITLNTEKQFRKETTRKVRLYTLWEEKLKQKHLKSNSSKSRNLRREDPKMFAESDTVINVNRAVFSSAESSSDDHKRRDNYVNRDTKSNIKQYTETTKFKYKATTHKKYRKYIPKATTIEEGLSIESYENHRRSMPQNSTEHVLRRINDLEKQMQEVKSKIETKRTSVENTLLNHTQLEFEFWESTAITNNTIPIPNITMSTKAIENVTHFETTIRNIQQSDFNKTKYEDKSSKQDNITNTPHTNNPGKIESSTASVINKNTSDFDDNNSFYANVETYDNVGNYSDNLKDEMMQNSIVKPDVADNDLGFNTGDKKEKANYIENDLKKVMGETNQPMNANDFIDPFQDLNSALDVMVR